MGAEGGNATCNVTEIGTGLSWSCQFPFVYNNQTWTECTTSSDPDGKAWCSTRVDLVTRKHIGGNGFWGYCTENACNVPEENKSPSVTEIPEVATDTGNKGMVNM